MKKAKKTVAQRSRGLLAALTAIVAVSAPVASAHRVGVPITEIYPNPRTGNWEVVHRLDLHDLDAVVSAAGQPLQRFLEATGSDQRVEAFVSQAFGLTGQGGPVELQYVGFEADTDFLWVYFEFSSADQDIAVRNALLIESETSTAYALVNLKDGDGNIRSARFTADKSQASMELCWTACPATEEAD